MAERPLVRCVESILRFVNDFYRVCCPVVNAPGDRPSSSAGNHSKEVYNG